MKGYMATIFLKMFLPVTFNLCKILKTVCVIFSCSARSSQKLRYLSGKLVTGRKVKVGPNIINCDPWDGTMQVSK